MAKEKPCKWGGCNGVIVGKRCDRCGTVWHIAISSRAQQETA
jgi:hypothetical protein